MTTELPPQWQNRIPESDRAQASLDAAAINSFQRDFARRGDGNPHRAFHVKSHAGLRGTLRILPGLPAVARHGIFAEPRDFSALVRLSNGFSATKPDWFPDLVGLAVKVEGVDGDKLLPGEARAATQDFLALDRGYLPVDHAGHLMVISLATGNLLTAPFKLLRGLGMAKGLEVIFWTIGWSLRRLFLKSVVTIGFSGVVPVSVGPTPAKFHWRPRQSGPAPGRSRGSWTDYLRDELRRRLAAGDIGFDLYLQFHVDDVRTPVDGGYAWDTGVAPMVKVAELVVKACDLDGAAAQASEAEVNRLAFNPWHGIAAHQPVGNIQRVRGLIYQKSAALRSAAADPRQSEQA